GAAPVAHGGPGAPEHLVGDGRGRGRGRRVEPHSSSPAGLSMDRKADGAAADSVEQQIEAWRAHLRGSGAITRQDAAELEDHLREQIASLSADGLSDDEAFLVAVKRMGAIDALTREFAREHSERLWKQLVLSGDGWGGAAEPSATDRSRKLWVALGLAVAAAVAIKVPALFGRGFTTDS